MPRIISKKDGGSLAQHQLTPSKKKGISRFCRKCGNGDGHGSICGGEGNVVNNERTFKRGPWTAEEDALLIEYVKNHGERHWNCVQNTGLIRCGKSCRLRWTNHLRPDLKKGAFSSDEERVVLELHAKLGNKWSKIAAELPGRTDNEVKNFWNTKIKRRMKAEALTLNSEGSNKKNFGNLNHRLPHGENLPPQGLSLSIPNTTSYTSHSSLSSFTTPVSIPMSYSLSNINNDLSNSGFDFINSATTTCDPILFFLNNPPYKCNLILEKEKTNYINNANSFDLPFPIFPKIPLVSDSNVRLISNHNHPNINSLNTSKTLFTNEFPLQQMIHENHSHLIMPRSNSITYSTNNMLNNMCTTWSIGTNSKEEISSIINVGKSIMDKTLFENGREMNSSSLDNDMADSNLLGEQNPKVFSIGKTKSDKEPCEEMVSMDDDLSSLLYDF